MRVIVVNSDISSIFATRITLQKAYVRSSSGFTWSKRFDMVSIRRGYTSLLTKEIGFSCVSRAQQVDSNWKMLQRWRNFSGVHEFLWLRKRFLVSIILDVCVSLCLEMLRSFSVQTLIDSCLVQSLYEYELQSSRHGLSLAWISVMQCLLSEYWAERLQLRHTLTTDSAQIE